MIETNNANFNLNLIFYKSYPTIFRKNSYNVHGSLVIQTKVLLMRANRQNMNPVLISYRREISNKGFTVSPLSLVFSLLPE